MGRVKKKRRTFHGNWFTGKIETARPSEGLSEEQTESEPRPSTSQDQEEGDANASSSKIKISADVDIGDEIFGNRIFNLVNLLQLLETLSCRSCLEKIVFSQEKLVEQASTLHFTCGCEEKTSLGPGKSVAFPVRMVL